MKRLIDYGSGFMPTIVSLIILGSSLYVILSGNYDEGTQKWAFGAIGSILGFWLKDSTVQKV